MIFIDMLKIDVNNVIVNSVYNEVIFILIYKCYC